MRLLQNAKTISVIAGLTRNLQSELEIPRQARNDVNGVLRQLRLLLIFLILAGFVFPPTVPESHVPFIPPPEYESAAVVVMDADTGLVIYEESAHARLYPASIVKVMTALLVLENVTDLNAPLYFSEIAVDLPTYASHMGMQTGDTLTITEALYGILLPSANETARALAEHVSGSVPAFVAEMNRRAHELGAYNTRFVNPCGLPGEGQFITAYDAAVIMREALRHPLFSRIIATEYFEISPNLSHPEGATLRNTNQLIREESPHFNERAAGGKTGFTNDAQHTLVSYSRHDDRGLIIATLFAPRLATFEDTNTLLEYAFALPVTDRVVFDASQTWEIPVFLEEEYQGGAEINHELAETEIAPVTLQAVTDILFPLPINFDYEIETALDLPDALVPPIQEGEQLGTVRVYTQNIFLGEAALRADRTISEDDYAPEEVLNLPRLLLTTIAILFGFAAFLLLLMMMLTRRKRRRYRRFARKNSTGYAL